MLAKLWFTPICSVDVGEALGLNYACTSMGSRVATG